MLRCSLAQAGVDRRPSSRRLRVGDVGENLELESVAEACIDPARRACPPITPDIPPAFGAEVSLSVRPPPRQIGSKLAECARRARREQPALSRQRLEWGPRSELFHSARTCPKEVVEQGKTKPTIGTRSGRVGDDVVALWRRSRSPAAPSAHAVPEVVHKRAGRLALSGLV
jgi:hypothetical protein